MEELNQYVDVYILKEDIPQLIPSSSIKRYKNTFNNYNSSKSSLIVTFECVRLNEKLLKEVIKSTNVAYQQRKRLSLDNVLVIRSKLNDARYKIFQQYKANVSMSIGHRNKSNNNVRRSYDNLTDVIEYNMNDIYNADDYNIEYNNQSIQKALIKPEHFRRSRVKFIQNERVRVSEGNGLALDVNAFKYSPWEGTDFKYTLLISLQKKLRLKLIFNVLHHNANIKIMARQEALNCVRLRERRYKQLCFSKIYLEFKLVKHKRLISEHKALVYLQKKYLVPALKFLLRRRLYSLKRMKRIAIVLKYYDKKMLDYGINLLYWNVQYMRRTKQLSLWTSIRLSHMRKCRSFLAFVLCYMKRNLTRISLSTKNIDRTINSKDYFADDNDNIDIQNLRFNELRRECLKSISNQASITSAPEYVRKCANYVHEEKVKVSSGISGYWDSYNAIPAETSTKDVSNINSNSSRVMYIGGNKGISINIDKVKDSITKAESVSRTPFGSLKQTTRHPSMNDKSPFSANDDKSSVITGYQSVFAISTKSQASQKSTNTSILDVSFNDALRAAISSRTFMKTPVKQNVENINDNNQRYDQYASTKNSSSRNNNIDDYRAYKSFDDNEYEDYYTEERTFLHDAAVSPSFLQDAMNIAVNPKFSSNGAQLSLDDETNAAYRLVRKCKFCLKKFHRNAIISKAYRYVRRASLKYRKTSSLKVWLTAYKKVIKKYILCDQISVKKAKARLLKLWYSNGVTRFKKVVTSVTSTANKYRKQKSLEMWHHVFRMKTISKSALKFAKNNKLLRLFSVWKSNVKWHKKFDRIGKRSRQKEMRCILDRWKQKNEKTKLLRRVFRIYELAWLERDYGSCSQYRLMENVIQAWSSWARQQVLARKDEVDYSKALLFRGISLISNAFFQWADRTSVVREEKREKVLVEHKKASFWFRACYTSWKQLIAQTLTWRAIAESTHKNNVRRKVLRLWFKWSSVRSRVSSDKFRRNHLLAWVFDKWCEARIEYVLKEKMVPKFQKNKLQAIFRAWYDTYNRKIRLQKGIEILSGLHRYLKFRDAIQRWPGRWQWKAAQALLEKFKRKGRGRARLVEVIENRDDNKKLIPTAPPKKVSSFLEPARNKPSLLHRIAEMIMNGGKTNRKSVKETVEILVAVLYAWNNIATKERMLRGRARMVIVNQQKLLRKRLFKVWISQCSKTAKRAMMWIRTGGHEFKSSNGNGIYYDDV